MQDGDVPVAVRRSARFDTAVSLAANVVSVAVTLPTSILIARTFGPTGKGIVAAVALVVGQVAAFMLFGVDSAVVHFLGRERSQPASILRSVSRLGIVAGAAGALAGILLVSLLLGDELSGSLRWWVYLAMVTILLSVTTQLLLSVIRGIGRIAEASLIYATTSVLNLGAVIAAVLLGWGVRGILMLNIVASGLVLILVIVLCARFGLVTRTDSHPRVRTASLMAFGLKSHVAWVLQGINYRLDLLLVASFLPVADVGVYSVSIAAAEMLWLLPGVLGGVLMQRAASLESEDATRLTALATRLSALAVGLGALFLWAGGKWLIRFFFGTEFSRAAVPLMLLLPGVWAMALWHNLVNDLTGRGYPQYKSYSAGLGVALALALDILLIPRYGLKGAAIASSVSYFATLICALVFYHRVTGLPTTRLLVPTASDLNVLGSAIRGSLSQRRRSRPDA